MSTTRVIIEFNSEALDRQTESHFPGVVVKGLHINRTVRMPDLSHERFPSEKLCIPEEKQGSVEIH